MKVPKLAGLVLLFLIASDVSPVHAAPAVRIVLPERFRVLSNQLFDLRVEFVGLTNPSAGLQIVVDSHRHDGLRGMGASEVTTDNDNDSTTMDKAWTFRRVSFGREGIRTLRAIVTDGATIYGATTQISVQEFRLDGQKSIILFIGGAMGTAYRDARRIVAQSTGNRFREGFFDELQQRFESQD